MFVKTSENIVNLLLNLLLHKWSDQRKVIADLWRYHYETIVHIMMKKQMLCKGYKCSHVEMHVTMGKNLEVVKDLLN